MTQKNETVNFIVRGFFIKISPIADRPIPGLSPVDENLLLSATGTFFWEEPK